MTTEAFDTTPETNEVALPITREDLDSFIEMVAKKFNLPPDDELVWDGVATAIMHMPQGRAYAPVSYFGNCATRSLAQKVAYELLTELAEKRKADAKAKAEALKPQSLPETESVDGKTIQGA